jgi:hypothetical protein
VRDIAPFLGSVANRLVAQKTAADAAESSSWFSAEARAALARKGVHH